jgi:hypothetical protein
VSLFGASLDLTLTRGWLNSPVGLQGIAVTRSEHQQRTSAHVRCTSILSRAQLLSVLTERDDQRQTRHLGDVYMRKTRRICNDGVCGKRSSGLLIRVVNRPEEPVKHLRTDRNVSPSLYRIGFSRLSLTNLFDHLLFLGDITVGQRFASGQQSRVCLESV